MTTDQPLFVIAKMIQRNYPKKCGKTKLLMVFGAFSVVMLKNGWNGAIFHADIMSSSATENFLKVTHVLLL